MKKPGFSPFGTVTALFMGMERETPTPEKPIAEIVAELQRRLVRDLENQRFYGMDQQIRVIQKTLSLWNKT